jgi:phenylpropionate dioxygenase-like ring-hydroxylating dioxygenase large terminal subunit
MAKKNISQIIDYDLEGVHFHSENGLSSVERTITLADKTLYCKLKEEKKEVDVYIKETHQDITDEYRRIFNKNSKDNGLNAKAEACKFFNQRKDAFLGDSK